MVRVAIIEDDINAFREIESYVLRYGTEHMMSFQIDHFSDGDEIVEKFPSDYDILLMDIELPLLDGMTAAEEIRKKDKDVEIVFITNSPHYAIRGYRVGALDYIVKPINYYAFAQTITRALERTDKKQEKYLVVNIKGGKRKISIRRIRYVEVRDHDLIFHLTEGNITAKGTLRELESRLKDFGFFHCNKGYLINLAYVDGITGQEISIGEDVISVGRTRKKAFMDAMNAYLSTHNG